MPRISDSKHVAVPRGVIASLVALMLCCGALLAAASPALAISNLASTAPPTISSPQNGAELTANPGTFSGGTAPLSYSYQWQRCGSTGQGCADIPGEINTTYTPTKPADTGHQVTVVETATDQNSDQVSAAATPVNPFDSSYSSAQMIPVPPASSFAGNAGGDGWALALSSTQAFNIFHHQNTLQVSCHEQADASNCWSTDPETITDSSGNNFAVNGHPGLYLAQATGKLYAFATRASDGVGGVVCIDTKIAAVNTDPFCGFTALTGAGDAAYPGNGTYSNVSDVMHVGSKLYAFNYVNGATAGGGNGTENAMLCFDLTTHAACSGQPFVVNVLPSGDTGPGTISSGTAPEPAVAAIGTQLIVPMNVDGTDELACFETTTAGSCSGSWPATDGVGSYPGNYGAPFPMLDSTGTLVGVCLPTGGVPCYHLDGSDATTPSGLAGALTACDGCSSATNQWDGPAVTLGPRVYVPNGNTNELDCFDYSTGASCANFPFQTQNLGNLYTVNPDPQRPTCLWLNANDGGAQIQNLDAYTGGPCGEGPIRALTSQFVVNSPTCSPSSFTSLQVVSPAPGTYTSGTVSFQDADGNTLAGSSPVVLDANGIADLTALHYTSATGLPQFLITLNGTDGRPSEVDVRLNWTGANTSSCDGQGISVDGAPAFTAPPTISGTPQTGQTLTADPGSWYPTDSTFTYQWSDCDAGAAGDTGSNCQPITDGTGSNSTYQPVATDLGRSLAVSVTATSGEKTSEPVSSVITSPVSGPAAHVALGLSPSSITANGTSRSTATATVTDASGNPVYGDNVQFSSDGGQTIGSPSAGADPGTYAATITSSTTAGNSAITAQDLSPAAHPEDTATLTQVAGPPSSIQLALAPSTIPADGHTTSTATATVSDLYGNPISGDSVTMATGAQGVNVGTVTAGTAPGTYQATVTATNAGTASITATDPSGVLYCYYGPQDPEFCFTTPVAGASPYTVPISQSTTLTTTVPAAYVSVSLSPGSITADGTSASTATAMVTDLYGNPVSGDDVHLTATGPGAPSVGTVSAGNAPGAYVATVTSNTTAGNYTITGRDVTPWAQPLGTALLSQTAGPATQVGLVLSPSSVKADGSSTSVATATVSDVNGNPVSDDQVTIGSDGAQQVSLTAAGSAAGTYRATITSTSSVGSATITATDSSVGPDVSQSATLTQTNDRAAYVAVSLSPGSITADGISTSTATVSVTDQNGNAVSGDTVTVGSSGSQQIGSVSAGPDPGSYQATVTSATTAGSATITATDMTASQHPFGTVLLSQTAGAATQVALVLSPSSVKADGSSVSTATATVSDQNGNPVSGDHVTIGSGGAQQLGSVSPGASPGTYQATITSTATTGTATITATDTSPDPSVSQSATLTQTSDRAAFVAVGLSPGSITADGSSTSTATVSVTDQNGNPVSGDTVTVGSSGSQQVGPVTAGPDPGSYQATVTSTTAAGSPTITATDMTASQHPFGTVSLSQTAGTATQVGLVLSPSSVKADGSSTSVATATVSDQNGNAVSGDTVAVGSSGLQNVGPTTDHGDGTYTATVTSTSSVGPATITATDASPEPSVSQTATLTQTSDRAAFVTVALSPGSITANGTSTSTATATVTDGNGNLVSGDTVTLLSSGAQQVGPVTAGADPGSYQATFTSTSTAGSATITATDTTAAGHPSASRTLTQTAGRTVHVVVGLEPASIKADGSARTLAVAFITDAHGNPISGEHVTFTSSGAQALGAVGPGPSAGLYAVAVSSTTAPGVATITATDAGMSGTAKLTQTDVSAPVGLVGTPVTGGVYLQHQRIMVAYSCVDPDGATDVVRCAGPVAVGSPLDTKGLGTHTFIIHAADRAGNASRVTVHYDVVAPDSVTGSRAPFVYLSGPVSLLDGTVSVPLGCESSGGSCSGSIRLKPTLVLASGGPSLSLNLGSAPYSLARGKRTAIRVPLSPAGRRLLGLNGALPKIIVTTREHGPWRRMALNGGS